MFQCLVSTLGLIASGGVALLSGVDDLSSFTAPEAKYETALRFHHDRDAYAPGRPVVDDQALGLIAVTHVAEGILMDMAREVDIEVGNLLPQALAYLGLSEDDVLDLKELLAIP